MGHDHLSEWCRETWDAELGLPEGNCEAVFRGTICGYYCGATQEHDDEIYVTEQLAQQLPANWFEEDPRAALHP
jgi:hypothetical protein